MSRCSAPPTPTRCAASRTAGPPGCTPCRPGPRTSGRRCAAARTPRTAPGPRSSGRLLVGHLEKHREQFARCDVITTGALDVGPRDRRLWDHLRLVLDAAAADASGWTFAPDLITKDRPTGQFLGRGVETRRAIAEHSLRDALAVPEPERVAGRRVLVLDDVYSEGFSLREMARALRGAGAEEVAGLVFTRRKGG